MSDSSFLKSTLTGRPAVQLQDADVAVYLYTASSVYALDAEGFCKFACDLAEVGDGAPVSSKVDRCVGAQYAACLDLSSDEGLIPDPRVGCHALFIGRGTGARMALVKTPPLTQVVYADEVEQSVAEPMASAEAIGWDEAPRDASWLRSTKVGHPAMVDAALEALRRSGKSPSLPWLQKG